MITKQKARGFDDPQEGGSMKVGWIWLGAAVLETPDFEPAMDEPDLDVWDDE